MRNDVLLYADEPPVLFLAEDSLQKKFDWVKFSVSIDQIERQMPRVYKRLLAEGKESAIVMAVHGTESGMFSEIGRQAVSDFKPDMIICCHPNDVRHLATDLPIWGWSSKSMYISFDLDSRVIRIFEDD